MESSQRKVFPQRQRKKEVGWYLYENTEFCTGKRKMQKAKQTVANKRSTDNVCLLCVRLKDCFAMKMTAKKKMFGQWRKS